MANSVALPIVRFYIIYLYIYKIRFENIGLCDERGGTHGEEN